MKDVVILIPSYNPSDNLLKLVLKLKENNFSKIIIVNDGSSKKNKIFSKLKEYPECDVLEYQDNKGKGYALKYGINYYLENYQNEYIGIVTVDADLQHLPNDIINISLKLLGNQDSLILGTRDFNLKTIPFFNKFGNKLTSLVFWFLYGKKINDTQTGLRGIPNRYLHLASEASGKRFEYEMNMLIKFTCKNINILSIPIETIYYKKSESKFNKVIDSLIIYKVLFTEYLKFTLSSLICFLIDIVLFMVVNNLFNILDSNLRIIIATCIARIITNFINFNFNRQFVFNSHEKGNLVLGKYYLLSIFNMISSALLVVLFHNLFNLIDESILKIIVDFFLYLISYKIQKKYIFKT